MCTVHDAPCMCLMLHLMHVQIERASRCNHFLWASERVCVCSEVVNEVQHKTINRNPLLFSRQFFFALESVFSPVYAALALAALFVLSLFVLASVSGVWFAFFLLFFHFFALLFFHSISFLLLFCLFVCLLWEHTGPLLIPNENTYDYDRE